jgi:hypothetical protein
MNRVYRISETQFEAIIGKKQVYNTGYEANRERKGLESNPYETGTEEHESWKDGWLAAEAKSQASHDDAMLSREIGENEEVVNEVDSTDEVFTSEIKSNIEIDFNINYETLFPGMSKPGTNGRTIVIDGMEYDPYITVSRAVTKYSIDVDYRSFGIKDIGLTPISVAFVGTLEMQGEDDSYEKDFELFFDRMGLRENTLSGAMDLAGKTVNIPQISDEVVFDAQRESDGDSYYVSSVEFSLQPNKIIFKY